MLLPLLVGHGFRLLQRRLLISPGWVAALGQFGDPCFNRVSGCPSYHRATLGRSTMDECSVQQKIARPAKMCLSGDLGGGGGPWGSLLQRAADRRLPVRRDGARTR